MNRFHRLFAILLLSAAACAVAYQYHQPAVFSARMAQAPQSGAEAWYGSAGIPDGLVPPARTAVARHQVREARGGNRGRYASRKYRLGHYQEAIQPEAAGGDFIRPVSGPISSYFGAGRRRSYQGHLGIDLRAHRGTPILAARDGRVVYAGWQSGYGRIVKVRHDNGLETWYAHCSKLLVRAGEQVRQGEAVGRVGMTGIATGHHLHFEIRRDGAPRNPLRYLR